MLFFIGFEMQLFHNSMTSVNMVNGAVVDVAFTLYFLCLGSDKLT